MTYCLSLSLECEIEREREREDECERDMATLGFRSITPIHHWEAL